VVYCRSGYRSVTASKALVKLGFGRVRNLSGGIVAWKKAGGEVIKD
jgi:rhodanese-related sulfurtransferase